MDAPRGFRPRLAPDPVDELLGRPRFDVAGVTFGLGLGVPGLGLSVGVNVVGVLVE